MFRYSSTKAGEEGVVAVTAIGKPFSLRTPANAAYLSNDRPASFPRSTILLDLLFAALFGQHTCDKGMHDVGKHDRVLRGFSEKRSL